MATVVTGSSGFIGRAMVARLRARGMRVIGVDVASASDGHRHVDDRLADITDLGAIRELFAEVRPDYLINLAARTDISPTARVYEYGANVDGVANLLRCVQETGTVRRAVWISTQLVSRIGRMPLTDTDYSSTNTYGDSKAVGEKLVRSFGGGGTEWVIGRPTTIWGPGMSAHYQALLRYIERRRYFHVGDNPLLKSFGFIHNTTYQIERLLLAERELVHGQTFYLADYEPLELKTWCNALADALGAPHPPTMPVALAKCAARAGDVLAKTVAPRFPFNSFLLGNILTPYPFDMSGLKRVVGELPFGFGDAIKLTVEWYRSASAKGTA